jgi:hypothetical protein
MAECAAGCNACALTTGGGDRPLGGDWRSYAERRKSMVESRRGKLTELDSALEPLTFDFRLCLSAGKRVASGRSKLYSLLH